MILELDGIDAGYGDTQVLRQVSLGVPEGAVVALLGPNGAGKTTLLRVACGLLPPTAGQVRLDGRSITSEAPARIAQAGVCHVPEGRGVFPSLTVRENLRLHGPRQQEEALIEQAVAAFPILGSRLGQLAGTLSGGQQQMVAVARAYANEPRIVLLDEVSMGLAPKVVDEIFEFLAGLVATGVALLLVEQYVDRALGLADYVFLMNKGTITFCGDPAELADGDLLDHYLRVS